MGWISLFQRIWTLFSPSCWPLTHSPPLLVGIEPSEDDLCYKTKLWIPLVLFLSSLSQSFKSNLLQVDVALPMQTGEINFPNSEEENIWRNKFWRQKSQCRQVRSTFHKDLFLMMMGLPCSTLGAHNPITTYIQSGASSLAKHGGAYFSAVYGSIQDPIAAPGLFDIQVP